VPLQQLLAGEVPIATALSFLLRLGTAGLGSPVELEFALKMRRRPSERHQLHLLQIRPQAKLSAKATARFAFLPDQEYAAIASKRALGHGRFDGVLDVVYVSPNRFEKHNTRRMAQEISAINRKMQTAGRKYLLMAPGRWGSADETTGIPVSWENITSCGVIVETVLDKQVPLSQGSHFFQNIISYGLGYMTIDPSDTRGAASEKEVADYAFWDAQPETAHGTKFVRHVALEEPLEIVIDGQSRHGVVMKPGKRFEVYVGQVDAFMALQEQYN